MAARAHLDGPSVTVSLRVPQDVKDALAALAAREDRTLNNYVSRVLTEHLSVAGKPTSLSA